MPRFLGSNIGGCPHTEGLFKAARIAKIAGIESTVLPAGTDDDTLFGKIAEIKPDFLGLSYRLSPDNGYQLLRSLLSKMAFHNLTEIDGQRIKIGFAGLPDTIEYIRKNQSDLPCQIVCIPQHPDPFEQLNSVFAYFEISGNQRSAVLDAIRDEYLPPRIEILDQLTDEVVAGQNYLKMPPLPVPSDFARKDMIARMRESEFPLIRSHFGIPGETIQPTVDGIRQLAEARCVDEISLGSSDLSQRFYGRPELFDGKKNDGGVPYKNFEELKTLVDASRTGNFPGIKPYAHVTGICDFIDDCLKAGALKGAHQAIPLFWFNQLDGRGDTPVQESIQEHITAVKKLAEAGVPVEMNDPNQWSSRWAHDAVVVADYGLISAVMTSAGVQHILLQMQFNKPQETSDYGDIAKFLAAQEVAKEVSTEMGRNPVFYTQTRTGIESFSTDEKHARKHLARSTLLQMFVNPSVIHLVSFCEANRIAGPEEVIESSQIIRRAVQVFRDHQNDLIPYYENALILERKRFLANESRYILNQILSLSHDNSVFSLADPEMLHLSLKKGIMAAPGIMNTDFHNPDLITKPVFPGVFDAFDTEGNKLTEKERMGSLNLNQL